MTAVDFTAATARWSSAGSGSMYIRVGTVWYGMMCRAFVLLERLLRSCLDEYKSRYENLLTEATPRRWKRLTMGQCLHVLRDAAPALSLALGTDVPESLRSSELLLPEEDLLTWEKIVDLRNQMMHQGPGFLDSVDLFSGRVWRKYEVSVPLDEQSRVLWELGRRVCRSALVLNCIALQGASIEDALKDLERAESLTLTFRELSTDAPQAITEFHASGQAYEGSS